MLTNKQEKFVQGLVKGKSQRAAYKAAYNAKNMKDATVDRKACELFKQDKIRARYDELINKSRKRSADNAESMRAFIIETYKKIASGEICETSTEYDKNGKVIKTRKSVKPSDVNTAIAKLAEFYGVAPEEKTSEIQVILKGLDEYAD